jgi:nucleotide-binding universal stress UspA family protein
MEKILLAIDAVNPDTSAMDFACYLGRLTKSKVTGIFLENLVAEEKPVWKKAYGTTYLDWEADEQSEEHKDKQQIIDKNIAMFKQACENRSVQCKIHRDRGAPAEEIISESRYADLLILDAATSFNKRFEGVPTEFVKDVLKNAECPVFIAPESFEAVNEIIFAYDGSRSAAFAIKQFTYLLPEFKDKKATVFQANEHGVWADQDKYKLNEWLQTHYSSVSFEAIKDDSNEKLFSHLFGKRNVIIVMGAYGRTGLSRFFKHSRADLLISTIIQPFFIAHH